MASWPPFRDLVVVIRVCGGHGPAGHPGGRTVVALPPGLLALAWGAPRAPEAYRIEQVPTGLRRCPRPRSRRSTYARLPGAGLADHRGNSPPTAPIGLRAQFNRMDDLTAHAALALALRMEASMLAIGASAADVTATVLRVAAGYGLASCQVDVTITSLTADPACASRASRTGRRGRSDRIDQACS